MNFVLGNVFPEPIRLVSGIIFLSAVLLSALYLLFYTKHKANKTKYSGGAGSHPSHSNFHPIHFHTWLLKHLPKQLQPRKVKAHPHEPYPLKDGLLVALFHRHFGTLRKALALWLIFSIVFSSLGVFFAQNASKAAASSDFSIKTGYYYGNGTTLSVAGLGFAPQVVIIKADTAAGSMVWKSSSMPTNVTAYLGVATADNTETEITLGTDGFSVSPALEVNTVNVRYIYTAFAGSDCTSGGVMCVGSYVGDGSATKAITTGFQPNMVWAKRTTAVVGNFRTSSMSDNHAGFFSAAANDTTGVYYTTLNSGGFTVGLTNNANGSVYYYLAFKNVTNKFSVGQFTGDGNDNRNITGLGYEPDFIFVKQNSAVVPAFNTTEMWGDLSSVTTAAVGAVNHIQSLDGDGFQVGSSTSVNALGIVSNYFAFGGSTDPASSGSFYMKKGSYTGNGTSQSIDTGFAPDLVIIKGNTTEYGVWSTSLDNNLTHYMALSAVGFANGITAMSTSGFTVGTSTTVNTNGITFEYTAYGNATSPLKGAGAGDFSIGSYTGNGLSPRAIDHLGFGPSMVVAKRPITTAALATWSSSTMAANASSLFSATADVVDGTTFRSMDSTGFSVGTGAMVNTVNVTYIWFAFKEGTNFDVGTYTGTGVARNITGLGFDPDYVWTKRSTAVSAMHRSTSSTITTTLSQYFLNLSNVANEITGFVSDGYSVGTATEVNANAGVYQYAAWKTTNSANPPATPTNSAPSSSATAVDLNPTLTASAYADTDGNAQTDALWQVDNDSDFSSPVWTRTSGSSEETTSVTTGNGTFANELSGETHLAHNTTYYWRVKYSDGVWGSYSTGTSFTTNTISTPSHSSPADQATVTTLTPTLTASAFSDAQSGHTGSYAQWQIHTSSSFSSPLYDSGTVSYGNSLVVPSATLADRTVYYWRVRYKDSSAEWSEYSTATRFLVSQSSTALSAKPLFGSTVVDQGDSVKVDAQILSSSGTPVNDATVTVNVYNPSGTKIVSSQSMSYISSSNGIYRYAYTIPSENGSYLYDVTATSNGITGYGASNFEVRTLGAGINSLSTSLSTVNTNLSALITEVGTGNIAAIKTKTDIISWGDITGIVTSTGQIKTKTDSINWTDVSGIKTKTDTIAWSDITDIKTKTDTINWANVTSIKTQTDTISWSDLTGIVTANGEIKAKTDTINWTDVVALKTKTDTINWSDVTDIKTKSDTINWTDITTIKNSSVGVNAAVSDTDPSDTLFKTTLTAAKDDFYRNMVITFTSGNNSGQSRRIAGYTQSTKSITVEPPFSYTPLNGDTFLISFGSVRAEELAASARSTIESVQSKLTTLAGTLPSDYAGAYSQLSAIASQLSALGVLKGSGADSLYSLSSGSKDDIQYLKNKMLDMQAALEINKAMLSGGNQNSVVSTWYTFHSVVLNMLIANPTDRETTIPFKAYLPKEAKPEHIMASDGLSVEYDEGAQSYFVTGEFLLGGKESVAKKVEIKDIWQIEEEELTGYKSQAVDLYEEAKKTAYSAQGLVLKNDIFNKADKIIRKQKDNTETPQEHILTFRESQDDLTSIKANLKSLTELVTSAGASRGLLASVGGIQTISTWGIVVVLIMGLVILGAFSFSMWKHQMIVMAELTGAKKSKRGSKAANEAGDEVIHDLKTPSLSFSLPSFSLPELSFALPTLHPTLKWGIVIALSGGIVLGILVMANPFGSSKAASQDSKVEKETSVPAVAAPAKDKEKKVTIMETETGWLNVRAGAGKSFAVVTKVVVGDSFVELAREVDASSQEWIKIKLPDETTGWISATYAQELVEN